MRMMISIYEKEINIEVDKKDTIAPGCMDHVALIRMHCPFPFMWWMGLFPMGEKDNDE